MVRRFAIFLTIILFSSFIFHSYAQDSKRFGLGSPMREFKTDIKYLQKLGVGVVSMPLHWELVEPSPGKFDWSKTDSIVEAAQAKHVEVLFTLRCISSWGAKQQTKASGIYHSSSAPKNMSQWVRFVEALAARYRGKDVHYEIENEVNGKAFWSGTLDEYLELLKASYSAIKRVDPQAVVLSSAMGCGVVRNFPSGSSQNEMRKRHDGWLSAILATKAFDVVSVHDYYYPSEIVANGFTFQSYLDNIRNLMNQAGVGNRPIWITETGYVSQPANASGRVDNGSPEKQAMWLTQAYQQAFQSGVECVFWLLLIDRDEVFFGSMGLADERGNPRPALKALQQITGAR